MDDELLEKYLEYAKSEESLAVLFVKKHLAQAKGHWIDIVDCQRYEMYSDELLHFRFVLGGLYKRKIQPEYPSKSSIYTDREYYLMVRAITWETAHRDIEQQKSKNIASRKFKITGIRYAKNKSKSKKRSPKYVMIHYNHE